jgi:cell wall-associated NlpC family hydrolase
MAKPREKDKDDDRDRGKHRDRSKKAGEADVKVTVVGAADATGEKGGRRRRATQSPGPDQTGSGVTTAAGPAQSAAPGGGGGDLGPVPLAGGAGARIAAEAERYVGRRYVHATRGPDTFDCSGLVHWVVGQVTRQAISPDSHAQFRLGTAVDPGQLQPGDLLFYDTMDGREVREGNTASHVGVYVGPGRMINALNEERGVIDSDPFSPYFAPRFLGARRLG